LFLALCNEDLLSDPKAKYLEEEATKTAQQNNQNALASSPGNLILYKRNRDRMVPPEHDGIDRTEHDGIDSLVSALVDEVT